jgi:hypothetical protein
MWECGSALLEHSAGIFSNKHLWTTAHHHLKIKVSAAHAKHAWLAHFHIIMHDLWLCTTPAGKNLNK